MTSLERELKRGSAELLILALLEEQERHGYQIGQLIAERSDGAITFHVDLALSDALSPRRQGIDRRPLGGEVWHAPPALLPAHARRPRRARQAALGVGDLFGRAHARRRGAPCVTRERWHPDSCRVRCRRSRHRRRHCRGAGPARRERLRVVARRRRARRRRAPRGRCPGARLGRGSAGAAPPCEARRPRSRRPRPAPSLLSGIVADAVYAWRLLRAQPGTRRCHDPHHRPRRWRGDDALQRRQRRAAAPLPWAERRRARAGHPNRAADARAAFPPPC